MLVCHTLAVIASLVLVLAIRMPDKPIGKLYNLVVVVRLWYIWMWMYIIAELGVQTFEYSWYGWHVFVSAASFNFVLFAFVSIVLKATCFTCFFAAVAVHLLHIRLLGVEDYLQHRLRLRRHVL